MSGSECVNPSFGGSEIGDHLGARGKASQLSVIV